MPLSTPETKEEVYGHFTDKDARISRSMFMIFSEPVAATTPKINLYADDIFLYFQKYKPFVSGQEVLIFINIHHNFTLY